MLTFVLKIIPLPTQEADLLRKQVEFMSDIIKRVVEPPMYHLLGCSGASYDWNWSPLDRAWHGTRGTSGRRGRACRLYMFVLEDEMGEYLRKRERQGTYVGGHQHRERRGTRAGSVFLNSCLYQPSASAYHPNAHPSPTPSVRSNRATRTPPPALPYLERIPRFGRKRVLTSEIWTKRKMPPGLEAFTNLIPACDACPVQVTRPLTLPQSRSYRCTASGIPLVQPNTQRVSSGGVLGIIPARAWARKVAQERYPASALYSILHADRP